MYFIKSTEKSSGLILFLIFLILLIFLIFLIFCLYFNNFYDFYENYSIPKKIFVFWHEDIKNNKIIESHINSWRRNVPKNWEINIVTLNNIKDYVSNEFIEKYINLDIVRLSDFIRLELLKNNGGVWIDGGIIIKDGSFLDRYRNEMIKNKYDVLLYELTVRSQSKTNPYLENWFIMAPKNSKFIIDLYKEFDKSKIMGFLRYKFDILIPSGVNLNKTLDYDDSTYLMQHAIINYLNHIGNKYNICIKDSYESMFRIHNEKKWDDKKIINYIIKNIKYIKDLYAIKLTNKQRRNIDDIGEYVKSINSI